MEVAVFTFNAFAENTYVLYDDSKECIIIDPGCNNAQERDLISTFIEKKDLKPVRLINTHCHIDHVLGNKYVSEKYNLELEAHKGEEEVLKFQAHVAQMYAISYDESPAITKYIEEGEEIKFGQSSLVVLFTPGHSPASISLLNREAKILIAGDVLFQRSIGRTDLPGGNMETLLHNIRTKFFTLDEDVIVFPGHGPSTTIGEEKRENPFLN